jgi:N-carbamoyl-L-amino-acid hydrolase
MNRRRFSQTAAGILGAAMLPRAPFGSGGRTLMPPLAPAGPRVDGARIQAHLTALGEFGRNPEGGVSRVAYTEFDRQAREAVMAWMREAELEVSVDAAANLIGRRAGSVAGLPPILIGSHVDSVPAGGNFDGQVGSMGAIEVARTLAASGTALRHPLEVCIWSNEEGGTIGSHAVANGLTAAELDRTSQSGKTIREGIAFLGGDPSKLGAPLRRKGDIAGYLELHIEQGGFLDEQKLRIGVVEGIVGIRHWDVTLTGFGNHAGTTPMNHRKDALLAAARCIEAVNRIVTSVPGRQVGTVGKIRVEPGAYNVIPARAVFGVELRDLDDRKVLMLWARIRAECERIARAGGVGFSVAENLASLPALTDPGLRKIIAESARALGLSTLSLPSGAGHDAQEIARIGPVGMIFVPSVGGISHSPKEFTRPEDIENGANVLLDALLRLDRM